jgi:4-hydroxy-3-methylbut-2-enyl diphosphate reductase
MRPLRILLASPRGFCAGVRRAIDAVEQAIEQFGPPIYVRRAIVHNNAVVRELEAKGAIFVAELEEAPPGARVVLSAHGVAQQVFVNGRNRDQRLIDATCPLVAKIHRELRRHSEDDRHVILIGHEGHPEIAGSLGQLPPGAATRIGNLAEIARIDIPAGQPVAYAVQTTFSIDEADELIAALRDRFTNLVGPPSSDICYATTNRQSAVKAIAPRVDAMIVVGERFSSNACRLAEVARVAGCPLVLLVPDASELDMARLARVDTIGITAAASAPETSVSQVLRAIAGRRPVLIEEPGGTREQISFKPVAML